MPDHMPHEAKVEEEGLGTAKGALRSASNRQSAAQSDFQLMLQSMVDDGRLSAEKKVSMEAYVAKSVAEHNSGEETAWYEAMSSVNMEGFAELTAKGSPPAELLERVEDEYGAYFGPEVAARLRRSVLRWGSTAVGGGASAKGGGGGEGGGNIVVDAAGAGFLINGRPFLPWCDDQHLGDTLASDPTGTTVWNCAMVLAKLCECEEGRGSAVSPTICGARVLELGAGVGLCGLAAARLGAAAVMLTDANKTTLDLLALNIAQESEAKAWAAGAKVDLNSWDWRKKPSRRVFGTQTCLVLLTTSSCLFISISQLQHPCFFNLLCPALPMQEGSQKRAAGRTILCWVQIWYTPLRQWKRSTTVRDSSTFSVLLKQANEDW